MRKHHFLKLFVVLMLVLAAVGIFRGWISFSGHREIETGKVNVEVTVDTEKAVDDAKEVKDAARRAAKDAIRSLPNRTEEKGPERQ